jgi:hypothetical protein
MTEKQRAARERQNDDDEPEWVQCVRDAGCPVDVYVAAYIPDRRIDNPLPVTLPPDTTYYHAFGGDNHAQPIKGGSARMWQTAIVDLCADEPEIHKALGVGTTVGYRYETIKVRDVPFYDILTPAYRIVEVSDTAHADTSDMTVAITKLDRCRVKIKFESSASDPFVTLAPRIDYRFRVQLWCEEDEIHYRLTGRHDGYPAYCVFVGPTLVYAYNPNDVGETISALWGSGDVEVRERVGAIAPPNGCSCLAEDV